jgi:hypothetical protein
VAYLVTLMRRYRQQIIGADDASRVALGSVG